MQQSKSTLWEDAVEIEEQMSKLSTSETSQSQGADKNEKEEGAPSEELQIVSKNQSSCLSIKKFEELNLKPELLQGVFGMGFNHPTKIQEISLPIILGNPPSNLIAQAQSGTGKTAAFVLGLLSRIDTSQQCTQAIVVTPMRELANQIYDVVTPMGKFTTTQTLLAVPKAKFPPKITSHLVIGTPGTIQGLIQQGKLSFDAIKIFVLDEADLMLHKQGLRTQTLRLKRLLPKGGDGCQMLLFSATFDKDVQKFAEGFVPEPKTSILLQRKEMTREKIAEFFIDCDNELKRFDILSDLYCYLTVSQSIIFVERRDTAAALSKRFTDAGHTVSYLHGDLDAHQRDQVLKAFRSGQNKVLITTNVLARGIDIPQVSMVINYDLPLSQDGQPDFATYLHRVGRTGRQDRAGIAISFVHDATSRKRLQAIEAFYGKTINRLPLEELDRLDTMLKEIN